MPQETDASISHFYFVLGFRNYLSDGLPARCGVALYLHPRSRVWYIVLLCGISLQREEVTRMIIGQSLLHEWHHDRGSWKSHGFGDPLQCGAVNRSGAVACLPRFLAQYLVFDAEGKKGQRGDACTRGTHRQTHITCEPGSSNRHILHGGLY